MKLLLILVLLAPSLALDVQPDPRKQNMVTKVLGGILNQLFEKLSTEGASVPLLDMGEAGNFSNLNIAASGLTKYLDGIGSHGFRVRVNASSAVVRGEYHVVHLDVPGLFPIFGKGDFRVDMEAIQVEMALKATRNFTTSKFDFSLNEFDVRLSSSKVKFDNLMDDPHVADFLNELLSNLLPDLVPVIAEWSAQKVLPGALEKYGNGVFDCLKEDDIKQCIKDLLKGSSLLRASHYLHALYAIPPEMVSLALSQLDGL